MSSKLGVVEGINSIESDLPSEIRNPQSASPNPQSTIRNPKSAIPSLRELQPEQAAAAFEINKHVSVTAGPGSGKTTVLVERYLHVLRERRVSIDQIVAITFTNRAANEMRERLREDLSRLLHTAEGNERQRWLGYKRTLDGAVITTIHGFCARLLREFPVEARVDPQFLLLDEHRAAMLLDSVVEETLSEFISAGHVEVSRLTLGVGRGKLAAALAELYRKVRGQGLKLNDLALRTAASHATESDYQRALTDLDVAMNKFLAFPRSTASQKEIHSSACSSWPKLRPLLQTIPGPEDLAEYCRAVEGFKEVRPQARGALKPYVEALDELLLKKSELQGRVPQTCLDVFASRYALEMVNLLTRVDERLDEQKQNLGALDFDDLELRALALLDRPEVRVRAAERYRFFLVDEFQDTNDLQRHLLEKLALAYGHETANLFIVGDRKQSIYSFRGADVDVFRDMTATVVNSGGESKSLQLNFRSQPSLINVFNYLFPRLFSSNGEIPPEELEELGYVEHEPSQPKRESCDPAPLVELMVTTTALAEPNEPKAEQTSRELDAQQLALRIRSLIDDSEKDAPGLRYCDIALLFRAMSNVQTYESVFRRANIPYQTVLGKGFYERPEITDLIQLLRFLDNKTDELALAAVLRSPLCGISDNALMALRCAPRIDETVSEDQLRHFSSTRNLLYALRRHREFAFISDDEHELLERAIVLLNGLIARRHHYAIGELLRFAVEQSEYLTLVAANFDGPQRLANVHRLFTLAERFESSGAHLIRDFVRYVEDFEAIGSRESEGQIDEAANAVRLMTIHQAKGLEFPVVIIPDLQRLSKPMDSWFLLDRRRGLTLKVPDGRGKLVAGCTFTAFEKRNAWREKFESMRLLYVAATRAQDLLILSGTNSDLESLNNKSDTWLKWIWQSLEIGERSQSGIVDLAEGVQLQLTVNLTQQDGPKAGCKEEPLSVPLAAEEDSLLAVFPLLKPIEPSHEQASHRFSVTQLINYQRCPRQYYFDRILHVPSAEELAVWNDAEAPEPPANLTATLKGAVIHRFCETYRRGEDPEDCVRVSLMDIIRQRQAEFADRLLDIDQDAAVKELLPLAENYITSDLFSRIETARLNSDRHNTLSPAGSPGLWSELSFRLRRPLGVVSGAIDKLLITRSGKNELTVEVIDFKTNRLRARQASNQQETHGTTTRRENVATGQQFALDFMISPDEPVSAEAPLSLSDEVSLAARDYQLQMQAYALAARTLVPGLADAGHRINVTLHFLDPNLEFQLPEELLRADVCAQALDDAMRQIASSLQPEHFTVRPNNHCRMCIFLGVCRAGREWLAMAHK